MRFRLMQSSLILAAMAVGHATGWLAADCRSQSAVGEQDVPPAVSLADTMDLHAALVARLVQEEGFRSTAYLDTENIETIGYGFELQYGFTEPESRAVLSIRADSTIAQISRVWTPFNSRPFNVRLAVADMEYELGLTGALEFRTFLRLLAADSLEAAVADARRSLWARQAPNRAASILSLLGGS